MLFFTGYLCRSLYFYELVMLSDTYNIIFVVGFGIVLIKWKPDKGKATE